MKSSHCKADVMAGLIVNLTSAQLGHWLNAVTFLGIHVSSLRAHSVCHIERDKLALSSWEVEGGG